jgi:methyl-accepting chemotaxis protein
MCCGKLHTPKESEMKIGAKLYAGFISVVVIFAIVAVYMIVGLQTLHDAEAEMAQRTEDALELGEIEANVTGVYAIVADSIINRNLAEFKADFADAKTRAPADIKRVGELVDTEAEEVMAADFGEGLNQYIALVDDRLTPILEKEESLKQRAEDSMAIMDMEIRIGDVYAVMADGIINQDIAETRTDFASAKQIAQADIALALDLSDTDAEVRLAESFGQAYQEYLSAFETQVLPLLESGNPDMASLRVLDGLLDSLRDAAIGDLEAISASLEDETNDVLADEAEIRVIDGEIDDARDAALIPLEKIVESLLDEYAEAALGFDTTLASINTLTVVLTIAGLIIAMALAFFITRGITKPLTKVTEVSNRMALGDFGVENLDIKSKDEIGILAQSFAQMIDVLKYKASLIERIAEGDLTDDVKNASDVDGLGQSLSQMSESLNQLLSQVTVAVQQVTSGSSQVSQAGQSLSQGAAEQASSLEEISSSLTEINGQSKRNAENATEANALAKKAVEDAEGGNIKMKDLLAAMERINSSSDEISKVVKVIDDIAFQINLLALNANVEAARAGKYGKGFAVVADEVRNLAVRSAQAVKETTGMVEDTTKAIEDGTAAAELTAQQLDEIVQGSTKVAEYLGDIALASDEQAQGVEQTNAGLDQIDQVTQSNTASAEESASAGEELAAQAQQLADMISRFKLKGNTVIAEAPAPAVAQIGISGNGGAAKASGTEAHAVVDPEKVIQLDDDNFSEF